MDDFDHQFAADSDCSGDGDPEATPTPVEKMAEQEADGGSAAINAVAASAEEPNRQDPDPSLSTLASQEETEMPRLPVEPAATAKSGPSCFDERPPDFDLLAQQLVNSVPHGGMEKLADGAVAQYLSLNPQDPIESMIGRLIVAGTNASMDCFGRAAQCNESPHARDLNLRQGFKGSAVVGDLVRLWQSGRGQGSSKVTVGEVNVAAGGQAIVGNIQTGEPPNDSHGREALPPTATNKNDG